MFSTLKWLMLQAEDKLHKEKENLQKELKELEKKNEELEQELNHTLKV